MAWLGPLTDTGPRAGALCRHHADTMVLPRGWWLDDRRGGEEALFEPPATVAPVEVPEPPRPRRPRRPRAVAPPAAPEPAAVGSSEVHSPLPPPADGAA